MNINEQIALANAPLPAIDANGGGVSVTANGCEKYIKLIRYGQYGQVGADGVWRGKEDLATDDNKGQNTDGEKLKNERSFERSFERSRL